MMPRAWIVSVVCGVSVVSVVSGVACGSDATVDTPPDGGANNPPAPPPQPPPPPPAPPPQPTDGGDMDASICNRDAPFGTPQPYMQLTLANADHVFFSPDQLTGWFSTVVIGTPGPNDLFFGTRANASATFTPTKSALSTVDHDENRPSLSADGKVLVYENTADVGPTQIMVATRDTASGDFTTAVPANVNDANYNIDPWLTADGTLYFSSDRDGGVSYIFAAPPTATAGQWGTPVRVSGIDTTTDENENPVVTNDHLMIFFSRIVSPMTEPDVYVAVRKSPNDAFDAPQAIPTLARADQPDYPTWATPDGCTIFVSHRPGIFVAKRGP